MTTELEKQFFDTFGIEPIEQEVFVLKRMVVKEYPMITDRILLELICIFNKDEYDSFGNFKNVEEMKEFTLKQLIIYNEYYKQQVQALFKE